MKTHGAASFGPEFWCLFWGRFLRAFINPLGTRFYPSLSFLMSPEKPKSTRVRLYFGAILCQLLLTFIRNSWAFTYDMMLTPGKESVYKRLNSPDQTKTDSMVVLNFVRNSATFLKFRSQNHNLGRICDRFNRNLEHWPHKNPSGSTHLVSIFILLFLGIPEFNLCLPFFQAIPPVQSQAWEGQAPVPLLLPDPRGLIPSASTSTGRDIPPTPWLQLGTGRTSDGRQSSHRLLCWCQRPDSFMQVGIVNSMLPWI